jgi:hypothetical protein
MLRFAKRFPPALMISVGASMIMLDLFDYYLFLSLSLFINLVDFFSGKTLDLMNTAMCE